MTRPLLRTRPWAVAVARDDGGWCLVQCVDRLEWLAEWVRCVAATEGADAPAAERRRRLERALAANRDALWATAARGSAAAVLDVSAWSCTPPTSRTPTASMACRSV